MLTIEEAIKKRDQVQESVRMLLDQLCRDTGLTIVCDRSELSPGRHGVPSAHPKFRITMVSPTTTE